MASDMDAVKPILWKDHISSGYWGGEVGGGGGMRDQPGEERTAALPSGAGVRRGRASELPSKDVAWWSSRGRAPCLAHICYSRRLVIASFVRKIVIRLILAAMC